MTAAKVRNKVVVFDKLLVLQQPGVVIKWVAISAILLPHWEDLVGVCFSGDLGHEVPSPCFVLLSYLSAHLPYYRVGPCIYIYIFFFVC